MSKANQERHATKCLNILSSERCRQILKSILQIIKKTIKMKKHDNSNMPTSAWTFQVKDAAKYWNQRCK